MADLIESSRLFDASCRLDSAATILNKLSEGRPPTPKDREALVWAGSFLNQVDWTAGSSNGAGVVGNLAVQATAVRPTFYAALISLQRRLIDEGLTHEKEVIDFLRRLYQLLKKGGSSNKAKPLPAEKLRLASVFLHELSQRLLIQLTDNGVPRDNELLLGNSM
jgi:hypothetical protein